MMIFNKIVQTIDHLGSVVITYLQDLFGLAETLVATLLGILPLTEGKWYFLKVHIFQQLYFTAAQRVFVFTAVGLLIGVLTAFPLYVLGINDPRLLAKIMHLTIYHQLGPILASLFVIGLSGTAITAEIGTLKANQTIDCLSAMGINPYAFFILPRLIGMILSLLILSLWMNIGVSLGAGLILMVYQHVPLTTFLRVCMINLDNWQSFLTVLMIFCYAVNITLIHNFYAFKVVDYVDVPRTLPKAFARSFVSCLMVSMIFAFLRYG